MDGPPRLPAFNHLTPRDGCQWYIIPSAGHYNLTYPNGTLLPFESTNMWVFAVNCSTSAEENQAMYHYLARGTARGPFRSSLTPLMVVMSLCVVASFSILILLSVVRRRPRPLFHKIMLVYQSIVLFVLYGFLHHFSRQEHIKGYESTDSFAAFFYGTKRCVMIFIAFTGFIICEGHVTVNLFQTTASKRRIFYMFMFLSMLDTGWWIAALTEHKLFNFKTRKISWRFLVWFYVEIFCHLVYFITFLVALYSIWHYAIARKNRTLTFLSVVSSVVPLITMVVCAAVRGCYLWGLPLNMIMRAIFIMILWDWRLAITHTMSELEREDQIGRLVSEPKMAEQFKSLGGDEGTHGTLSNKALVDKIISAAKHPRTLLEKLNILEVRTCDSWDTEASAADRNGEGANTSTTAGATAGGTTGTTAGPLAPSAPSITAASASASSSAPSAPAPRPKSKSKRKSQKIEAITHHPVQKHTLRIRENAPPKLGEGTLSSNSVSRTHRTQLGSNTGSNASSGAAQPESQQETLSQLPSEYIGEPISQINTRTSSTAPGLSTEIPAHIVEPTEQNVAPPQFSPHPGFRSEDYNNEKR